MTESTKLKIAVSSALVLAVSLSIGSAHFAFAESYSSYNTHYNIGHHEGALQAAHDKVYGGYYNTDCQRYDNSHTHTDAYCQGYVQGYVYNWHALRNDITISTNVDNSQSIRQHAQVNCFLAICNNKIGQKAEASQNGN